MKANRHCCLSRLITLIVLEAVLTLGLASSALAQLTAAFELDGDAYTAAHSGLPDDWDRVYNGTDNAGLTIFQTDPPGYSVFTTGAKDILDITQWGWADMSAPDKDEILDAYAAVYGNYLYFGADRYATNGDAYIGFWLLQGTATFNPDGSVTGNHQVGDILMLCNFVRGGATAIVPKVYMWVGSGGSEGTLDEITPSADNAWAVVNAVDVPSPWPYQGKGMSASNVFKAGAFFEGGANLAALGITGCFTDFICETRSSDSITAQLKDFVHRSFPSTPDITLDPARFCQGGSAQLCPVVTGGVPPFTFSWTTGSSDSCITVSAAGWYKVTITGSNGCSAVDSVYVTVDPLPACNITGDNDVCSGQTTEFCGPGGMTAYSWSGPGGFSKTTQCTGLISVAGTYELTITDANGCQNTCNRALTVYSQPACNITGDNEICSGQTTEFCATCPPGGTYSWSWVGPLGFTASTVCTGPISTSGIYTLTVTDANGCQSSYSRTLTVYANPICSITRTGGERDTICPCFDETDPTANNEYCGPGGATAYAWSILGGADIVGNTDDQCVLVRPRAHCDTTFTLYLTLTDEHGCASPCDKTVFVVDKTPPTIVYCPPDTVLECDDNLDDAFNPAPAVSGPGTKAVDMTSVWQPVALDDCANDPGADYADTGGRPTNWSRRVDSWGSCGEDTTVLRTWTVTDDCGNQAVCHQVIAIQDTVPPMLTCAPDETVPCGSDVVFTPPPSVADNCDPLTLLEVTEVSTEVVPGPDPGDFTHTRCWVAADSCGNASAICCQSITVEACVEKFCTFTQGGWGTECPDDSDLSSTQPGCLLERYFAQAFPGGSVGIGDPAGVGAGLPNLYAAVWTSPDAVQAFLPAGGTSAMLTGDATNPLSTSAGVLAGQILSLRLNVEFSCSGAFRDAGLSPSISCYRGFVIPASCGKFAGLTVEQFLVVANEVVGGRKNALNPYGATLSDLNFTASCLNLLFDNCVGPVSSSPAISTAEDARQATTSGAPEDGAAVLVPPRFFVRQSYPNPFNPSATIVFGLPRDGHVTVEVCDVAGRNVVTLLDAPSQAGYHSAVWFGKDAGGDPVASGVYFCRVRFDGQVDVQKLILLR